MDGQTLVIQAAVFVAAVFQSATGIGFGLIAGPVLLLVMNNASAVQVTILLSLLISAVLAPSVYGRADRGLLLNFVLGTVVGVPIGVILYRQSSIGLLKFTMGLVVLLMAVSVSRRIGLGVRSETTPKQKMADIGIGVLSGVMGASLAMPGPPVAARLSALGCTKDTVRATALALFVVSYGAALALQALTVSISTRTVSLALTLLPVTLLGMYLGKKSVVWIRERTFRLLIAAALAVTSVGLLASSFGILLERLN